MDWSCSVNYKSEVMGLGRRYYARNLGNNSSFDNAYSVFLNTLSVGGEPTPAKPIRDFSEAELFFLENAGFSDLINIPQGNFNNEVPSIVGDSLIVTGGGNGSRFDENGLLITGLPANRPRYNFENGVFQGVLLEKASRNILNNSNDFFATFSRGSKVLNADIGLDGTNSATLLNVTNDPDPNPPIFWDVYRALSPFISGETYSLSFWLKLGTSRNLVLVYNDSTSWDSALSIYTNILDETDGLSISDYVRVKTTFTMPSTNKINAHFGENGLDGYIGIQQAGNLFFDNFQFEEGSPTSYIKTQSSALTRPADIYTATGAISGSSYAIFIRDQLGKRIDYYNSGNKYTYRNGTLESTVVEAPSTDLVIDSFTGSDKVKTIALRLGTMTATELEKITAL